MGSATREAIATSRKALAALSGSVDLGTAADLFDAGRVVGQSAQLRSLISDPAAEASTREAIIDRVFGGRIGDTAKSLLTTAANSQWSNGDELLGGIEELGLRASAMSAGKDAPIESELFRFGRAVMSDSELELALSSKLGSADAKTALVNTLLSGKATPQTVAIVKHLVQQPRGRRIGELLRHAATIVADEKGSTVATVTSATQIPDAQLERLRSALTASYGRDVTINLVVDPSIIGGLRVQAGDDVIDGSIAARLADLRLQLAG